MNNFPLFGHSNSDLYENDYLFKKKKKKKDILKAKMSHIYIKTSVCDKFDKECLYNPRFKV